MANDFGRRARIVGDDICWVRGVGAIECQPAVGGARRVLVEVDDVRREGITDFAISDGFVYWSQLTADGGSQVTSAKLR